MASNAQTGFLGRQLANITHTLAKASQRRDAELQAKRTRLPTAAPAVKAFCSDPSVTSESDVSRSSDSGDSHAELERLDKRLDDFAVDGDKQRIVPPATMKAPLGGGDDSDEVDPKKMLADLDRTQPSSSMGGKDEADHSDDLKRMRAEFDGLIMIDHHHHYPRAMLVSLGIERQASSRDLYEVPDNDGDGPMRMLAELDRLAFENKQQAIIIDDDDPRAMLADLDSQVQASGRALPSCDLSFPSFLILAPNFDKIEDPINITGTLEKESIPYAVALRLESAGCKWEDVKGWITYLFSTGLHGHEAQKKKDEMIVRAEKDLKTTIKYVLEEEKRYRAIEDKERLPCRLIVTNLAADANEEELRVFLSKYNWDIRDVTLMNERDPIKRTKTAHVDMYTRKPAVRASYEVGAIFGLTLNIRLAVEHE
ncbi:hypothetical protein EJ02DRAFT_421315 [Clathrospora elynae]|uniref:RRM domain-containing protein n=1 Tax=Clathrospora elynae TaxID=706981 RepID=A0A6A5STJ2_9PLEO|nr:hypothetical protein EJ02DRAFT_421315 [Clathrospora elynae]